MFITIGCLIVLIVIAFIVSLENNNSGDDNF
jgi:hypothetical protein